MGLSETKRRGEHSGRSMPEATPHHPLWISQTEIVIVVHLGTRGSLGYAVSITRVEDQVGTLAVHYDELKPGSRCVVAQVLTQPHHIVRVRWTESVPVFIENEEIRDC